MTDNAEILAEDLVFDRERRELAVPEADADRMTIGEFSRQADVSLSVLPFYQSKGLLASARDRHVRVYSQADRDRLAIIL